jgi:ABC-type bacteriocin/lantibiotic exporter with double-glycine peptidase domain
MRLQLLYEVMGSIKELKILGRESFFLRRLETTATAFAKTETISQLSPLMARYVVEGIAFGGMLLIALYLICIEQDIGKFFPLLALYALAGYRLMPAMQQLFAALTSLKYHHSALDIIYTEMQLPANKGDLKRRVISFRKNLRLHQVDYVYPQTDKKILKEIDLNIEKQTTVGIVGTSGAGKTTILDIILGLLQPTHGSLLVDDLALGEEDLKNWQAHIGYVPQNIFLLDASIAQNIALGIEPENIDMHKVEHAAKLANLHNFIQFELPNGYQTTIGERGIRLSGGQRQRIGIARALYHEPDLLIFDEATSALDGVTEKVILEAIKNLGHSKTIILVAHRLNTVKDCDVIYVLNQGSIVGTGKYTDLCQNNLTFQYLVNGQINIEENHEHSQTA